jgi:phospholipid/cholesterol/gamma-HCH transport system substrate-binding protein
MNARQRTVRVGAFVVGGLLLFAVGLFLIGDRRLLFVEHQELETTLTKVTGLQVGTRVRIGGMNAGEVTAIDVPPRPSMPFVVRMRIRSDLAHLVRADSAAGVQTDGLVGSAFIQIGPGSDEAAAVAAGGRIRGVDPVELSDVLAETTATLTSFRTFVDDISDEVSSTLDGLTATVTQVNEVIDEVGTSLKTVTASSNRAIDEGQRILRESGDLVADIRGGKGTLGKLVTDEAMYRELKTAAARAAESVDEVRATTTEARQHFSRLLGPGGTTETLMADLGGAASASQEVLSDLAEHTEALKRNFLVRGFFQRRGFYDIDSLTPVEYRQFAADARRRRALRIWLDAEVLFATDEAGNERLTPEGRARLDLAMGTFLEQRRDSPLVVEGYATTGATSEQYLRSDARARLVRTYVARRFRREASITGAIGLASDARESPSGDARWDGVALALIVPR